jgi:uncharacterized protein (DUF433 family)
MKQHTFWKWLGSGAIAGILVFGGVAAERSFAHSSTAQPNSASLASQAHDHVYYAHPGGLLCRALVEATADLTGMPAREILEALQADKSLAQIAEEHGQSADAIVNAVVDRAEQRLNEAVANGRLTQDQANRRLAFIREVATKLVDTPGLGGPGISGPAAKQPILINTTAQVTGLTVDQVRAELQEGKSLAQIAEEHGQDADAILNELRAKAEARLDQVLERAREIINQAPGE